MPPEVEAPGEGGEAVPLTGLLARLGVRRRDHVTVARDFSVYSLVNITSLVLLLGVALFLRRSLGPYLAGIWTGLEILPIYAAYAHLGVLSAAERDLPYLLGASRTGDFDRIRDTLYWLAHALGLTLALGLAIVALALRRRVSHALFVGMLVFAPILWAQIAATYYLLLFRARKRFIELSKQQGIANLVKAGLLVAAGQIWGLNGVYAALLVAAAVQLALFHSALGEPFGRRVAWDVLPQLFVEGLPILGGAVAFDTMRNADKLAITWTLGAEALGVYSVAALICQGVFYLPNALSIVMYPRFQERYGMTNDALSLRRFVELPLVVLGDALLMIVVFVLAVVPPLLAAFMPQYAGALPPLTTILFGTYFVCLATPAGQFLLTVRKQNQALALTLPITGATLGAAWWAARFGVTGVAAACAAGFTVYFVALNAYAFRHFASSGELGRSLGNIFTTAALYISAIFLLNRVVPVGTEPSWAPATALRGTAAAILLVPLAIRFARRLRNGTRLRALTADRSIDSLRSAD